MKKIISLFAACALMLGVLSGCADNAKPQEDTNQVQRYTAAFYDVFDTVTTVIAYSDSQESFDAQMEALHQDLLQYHQLFDIYNEYEGMVNMATVNRTAAQGPVKVDQRILDMLLEAKEQYKVTQGQTNIAMGSVLVLWHDARDAAVDGISTPPEQALLDEASAFTNIDDLIIDEEAGTVYFADPNLRLDVGSCGKGYACEMTARAAEERGLTSALISVGGNLRSIGTKPDGRFWTGGVENPWDPEAMGNTSQTLAAVNLTNNAAMVTSGDYQRYFTDAEGVRYHHLIDPDTLQPARNCNSVTVITSDSGLADCLSTGLFCMTPEDGLALVESLDNVEAFWCLTDGTTQQSSGFANHMVQN